MTASPTRLSRSAGGLSSTIWLPSFLPLSQSEPHGARTVVWALPRSLAATCGIVITFSSSGYLDVSVHRVPSACLCIQHTVTGCASRVPPFGDPRIIAHVQLPAAFRSLSRPSSALSAKASALRPFLLNLCRSGQQPLRASPSQSFYPFLWFSVRVHGESMHAPCFGLSLSPSDLSILLANC